MIKFITAAFAFFALSTMALLITVTSAWASGGSDPATFRLTHALMDRMDKVATELTMSLTQAYNELESHLLGGPNRAR